MHALVIGVSSYDHLVGGSGPLTNEPLLNGLRQLSAAATSATRVALWLRDHFQFPNVQLGSIRLLVSPAPSEVPLPEGVSPPNATFDAVRKAVVAWRNDARSTAGNVALLYVAGHGIQTSNEGGILLLQDAGAPDSLTPLERAIDVASIRRGMVADPAKPDTATPDIQYYFYDACRIVPTASASYATVQVGVSFDEPRGPAPTTSYVMWGSRSRDYALADAEAKSTLFSKAFIDALASRAPTDADGRTVRLAHFGMALEKVLDELAESYGEQQQLVPGGAGPFKSPVCLRETPQRTMTPRAGPHAIPPAPPMMRGVVVAGANGQRFAMTIMDAARSVAAEGVTGDPVTLSSGTYTVIVHMPWGGTVERTFEVTATGPEVAVEIDLPEQPARSVQLAPRNSRQLGPRGAPSSRWCLRFLAWTLDGLAYDPNTDAPGVEVDDVDDSGVAIILHPRRPALQYAQLRTDDGRSLIVALPIVAIAEFSATCWLHVRATMDALGAVVRFPDPSKDIVAGYLGSGRPDQAVALAPSAESLLFNKVRDPFGAAIGGYALLRLNALERMHDWADNLGRWFDWLPDGAVIAGELAARQGQDDLAAEWYVTAASRGLPVFSEGLSLFASRVPQLVADADVPELRRQQLAQRAEPILKLSPAAEFGGMVTTLHLDPDPGVLSAACGWRRFGRRHLREDPSDFWSDP